ncbi:dihydrolipoamide dehydrogenase [Bombiscardovia nodaiensis]|uniref:Dihydrolipoamide dehydrogenase n=1 Tax=Bombiscardovia nodaiensis TaxID=2932181 RepID=A0ABN6SCD0_9BIFI|nr:dihydrolipoamide dehydrogenase [Bombiscardovia nodaiensis]
MPLALPMIEGMTAQASEQTISSTQHDQAESSFDLVIIGSGPGGYSTALRAAQLGLSVAVVERDAVVGGTCLNRGCIPTKALMTATSTITQAAHARQLGIQSTFEGIDFDRLNAFKQESIDAMTGGLHQLLQARKVTLIQGQAAISGPGQVTVETLAGSSRQLSARHIVLATGARSTPLAGLPFSNRVLDSDRALNLERFPQRPVIFGAGAVAVEFASIWQAAGSQVTLVIRKDRVLSSWDRRTSLTLTRELGKQGISVVTGSQFSSLEQADENADMKVSYEPVDAASGRGSSASLETDAVLVAIGRSPNTDASWLTQAGVELDAHGLVTIDPWGRTSADRIWALGDITAGYHFAHRAFEQGIVIAETIAGLNPQPVNEATIPQVVFSTPQAACVGYSKQAAQEREDLNQVQETVYPMLSNARMRMSGQGGSLSLVTACASDQPDTRIVVGVNLVAPEAAELIAEAEQIVGNRLPLSQAARLIHPHPTFSETLGEALLKADGRPLNMR